MTSPISEKSKPLQPNMTILEDRWLHNVMVFFSSFDQRSIWLNWGVLIAVLGAYFGLGLLLTPSSALPLTLILLVFMMLDLVLLIQLPKWQISFGPIASPFIMMSLPRLLVAELCLIIAVWETGWALLTMIVLQVAGLIVYLWSSLVEPHQLALTHLKVETPELDAGMPAIRLLHLSDLHLERLTKREDRLLSFISKAKPDLIVITGDYLNLSYNRDPEAIEQVRAFLPKITAPYGVYATLGSPPVDLWEVAPFHFENTNIRLLRNELAEVDLGKGRTLTLVGLDCTHDMVYDSYQLDKLLDTDSSSQTRVLLYHSPELMPHAKTKNIDLFLCGHTHGGQVRMPIYGAILTSACTGKQYEMGRYDEQGTTLYVSRGIGLEGMCAPRIRLFCPPEICLLYTSPSPRDPE